jgi:hypothetical protein
MKGFLLYLYMMKQNLNEQVSRIKSMMGLIMEEGAGSLVPQSVYDAIREIEARYSYMDNGKITGQSFKGNEIETEFTNYIKNTIGLDSWSKISEKLRAQIYAYAFQADSGKKGMTFRWIAGLSNAIDKNIKRLSIVNKNLNDPNVQNAINIIKNACNDGSINSHYNDYLTILDQQYLSGDYNDNYKYIWKYRPKAIERLIAGENKDTVFADWQKSFSNQQQTQPNQQQGNAININETRPATKKSLDELYEFNKNEFKTKPGKYVLSKFDIVSDGTNVTYTLNATPNENGYNVLAMVIGDEALKRVKSYNDATVLRTKMVNVLNQDTNKNQDYKVMIVGIKI